MKHVRWLILALAVASSSAVACGSDGDRADHDGEGGDGDGDTDVDPELILAELGELCAYSDPFGGTPTAGSTYWKADDCASGVCVSAGGNDAYCSAKCDDDWKQIDCPSGYTCKGPTGFKACQEN
jgi:hypothetical protein